MKVRYSPRAFADREAIFAYLDQRSPQGARNVKRAIVNAIRLLGSHPRMAPLTDEPGVRVVAQRGGEDFGGACRAAVHQDAEGGRLEVLRAALRLPTFEFEGATLY